MLAVEDLPERTYRVAKRNVLALGTGKGFSDSERLREIALDLARAIYEALVVIGKLLNTQNSDDVLQVFVALEHSLGLVGDTIVFLADDLRRKRGRTGLKRIDRGIDTERGERARKRDRGVEVRERRRRRGGP